MRTYGWLALWELFFCLLAPAAFAQNYYVTPSGSGSQNGSDWSNSYAALPATLVRGATYYVAGGSYSSYIFDDPESGTSVITIKKAVASNHGTVTGWQPAYGDQQAVFNGRLVFTRGYYTVDGQTRNESDWFAGGSYGIQISHNITDINQIDQQQIIMGNNGGPATPNITIQNVYISAPTNLSTTTTVRQYAIDTDTYGGPQNTGLVFSRMFVNGGNNVWFIRTTTGTIIEYCASNGVKSNGANHGEIVNVYFSVYNTVIRYNKFRNAYLGSGGTALIAVSVGRDEPIKPQLDCYGNVFSDFQCGDGAIGFTGNLANGGNGTNCHVYNNTFINGTGGTGIQFPDGSGNVICNNLWINCGNPPAINAGSGGTVSNNAFGTGGNGSGASAQVGVPTTIFANYAGKDFTLATGTLAGSTLSAPYNVDLLGTYRGNDGVWDRGAYEYVSNTAPAITAQPASRTVNAGQTATFSVTATGTAPLTYQWKKGTANVGTNSSSYTTPATVLADSGAQYSVVVSNSLGSVTSSVATLTVTVANTGVTIFTTQTPALPNQSDGAGVNYELGTSFQSSIAGQITGLRFWKDSSETGAHTGRIWSAGGTLLASVSFANETASGWQEQALASPLAIASGTVYTVSVNTGGTYYVATNAGLASAVVNGPLSTVVGNNGVYGSPGQFPTQTYQASNYFRDVRFVAGSANQLRKADFNGDAKSDLLFRHPSAGQVLLWLMN